MKKGIFFIFLWTMSMSIFARGQKREASVTYTTTVTDIAISQVFTEKTLYRERDSVYLEPFYIRNQSGDDISIRSITLKISPINGGAAFKKELPVSYSLKANQQVKIRRTMINKSTDKMVDDAYLIYAELTWESQKQKRQEEAYLTFFRVSENINDKTYAIQATKYNNLPVFTLKGGLSAEYTVQKALTALSAGISHSWNIPSPGMGPVPIESTPDFLERSVQQTVDIYDDTLGKETAFDTVIISTGIPSAAYLARTMNAPVLPFHFLVGANTVREIQTILDYSKSKGTDSYATIGHDYSLSNNTAVAWVKLLSLPKQYREFLSRHKVKQVIFFGALGQGGESIAKKLKDKNIEKYSPGSIYLMYFAGDKAETYLRQILKDFDSLELEAQTTISDWEAGIIEEQIENMSTEIKAKISRNIRTVAITTRNAIHLWNMGSFMMLRLLQKNNLELRGISLNPYLISHPVFESYFGYVPFLYFQFATPQFHIDGRLKAVIRDAITYYFPSTEMNKLQYWVNSTNNFGGPAQGRSMSEFLRNNGFTNIIDNDYQFGAEWNLADGLNSPVEIRAGKMQEAGVTNIQKWNSQLEFLNLEDLQQITEKWPDILFIEP